MRKRRVSCRVLTCNSYYFFNTNNLRTPYFDEEFVEFVSDSNGVRRTAKVFVFDVDGEKYYTVELSNEGGSLKITGGTLVTEWLERTLTPDECAIRDVIMDVEKLLQFMSCGLISDFRNHSCDTAYSIEYGNNPSLPEGLEEKLDQVEARLMINYSSMKITKEADGVITVTAVIGDGWRPEREVTFELERADNGYGYRIIGGTFVTDVIVSK